MFIVVLVELVNLFVLATNFTILEIIMNFLALVVLSEFDDFFFTSVSGNTVFGKALKDGDKITLPDLKDRDKITRPGRKLKFVDLLKIEVTTSNWAIMKFPEHKLKQQEEKEPTDPTAEVN